MKLTTAVTLGAVIIAAACSDSATNPPVPPPPPSPPPGSLVIRAEDDTTATSDTLLVGSSAWLRVMGVDSAAAVEWTVSDTGLVKVLERHQARVHVNGHKAGGVTMTATLANRSGTFAVVVRDVPAGDHPPNARIIGPTSAMEGTAVTLKATESSDPDHDALRYTWSFGDGSARDTASTLTHTYSDNGARTVTLVVTDPAGLADTASLAVAVKNAPPVISAVTVPSAPVDLGDSASVAATVSDPGSADVLTVSFDWGDGKTTSGPASRAAHLYTAAGSYSVKVTARDDDGDSASRSASVVIAQGSGTGGYDVIDLGTLGGNEVKPYALNDNGDVVGCSLTAAGKQHAFLWTHGTMRDLAPGSAISCAHTVTNSGLVAGTSGELGSEYVVRWTNGVETQVGTVYGEGEILVVALTGSGDVVARGHDGGHAVESALWHNGVKQSLGGLWSGTPSTGAYAMNHNGQIVGYSAVRDYLGENVYHAFIWERGVMRDLGLFNDTPCYEEPEQNCGEAKAVAINNNGQVVGSSQTALGSIDGVLWSNGTIQKLGFSSAVAINDAGNVAGHSRDNAAYFWHQGALTRIGSLGSGRTVVAGMNGNSIVAGWSVAADNSPHVFVWKPGDTGPTDLGKGPVGAAAAFAIAINERGDVLGRTFESCDNPGAFFSCGGPSHAILWRKRG